MPQELVHRPPLHLGFVFFSTPLFVPECVAEAVFAGRCVCVRSRPQLPAAVRNSLREVVMEGKGDIFFFFNTVFWWLSPVVFSGLQHMISL